MKSMKKMFALFAVFSMMVTCLSLSSFALEPDTGDISERMIAAYSRHIVSQLSAKGFYNIMQNLHLLWRKVISLLTWC